MAITSEVWSFLESSIFINGDDGQKFLGFATGINMSITYNVLTANAGRFSSDKKHYITTKDVEINIDALWFADDVSAYTPFNLYGKDGFYEDEYRDNITTLYFKLTNQENWDDDCIIPDPATYEVEIEIECKVASYDLSGNDPDIMISKIRLLGQKIKVTYN